jgi:hypothetical protein
VRLNHMQQAKPRLKLLRQRNSQMERTWPPKTSSFGRSFSRLISRRNPSLAPSSRFLHEFRRTAHECFLSSPCACERWRTVISGCGARRCSSSWIPSSGAAPRRTTRQDGSGHEAGRASDGIQTHRK